MEEHEYRIEEIAELIDKDHPIIIDKDHPVIRYIAFMLIKFVVRFIAMECILSNSLVHHLRGSNLPKNINSPKIRKMVRKTWRPNRILCDKMNSEQGKTLKPTQRNENMTLAGKEMNNYFQANHICQLNVLEVNAGNLVGSTLIKNEITMDNLRWIATDIIDYRIRLRGTSHVEFERLDQIDAVKKYGMGSNVLLLVSPMFCLNKLDIDDDLSLGFGDYYACNDFIEQKKTNKSFRSFIIFIGELGGTCGTLGMYKYLMENPFLSLEFRVMLEYIQKNEIGTGFKSKMKITTENELFIFEIIA